MILHIDQVIGPNGLLASKARIVVTNNIAFIKQFDYLVYMRRGVILEAGPTHNMLANPESSISKLRCVTLSSRCAFKAKRPRVSAVATWVG